MGDSSLPASLPFFLSPFILLPVLTNPHVPKTLVWGVLNPLGQAVWKTSPHEGTPGTWWPSLTPDICQLAIGLDTWDIPYQEDPARIPRISSLKGVPQDVPNFGTTLGCSSPPLRYRLRYQNFYVCPQGGRSQQLASRCPRACTVRHGAVKLRETPIGNPPPHGTG